MHRADREGDAASRRALCAEARRTAEAVLAANPGDVEASVVLALVRGRELREAGVVRQSLGVGEFRRTLDRALAVAPDDVELLDAKASLLLELPRFAGGDPAAARDLLERLLVLDPQNAGAAISLARAEMELGGLDRARASLERAIQIARDKHDDESLAQATARLRDLERKMEP
jgi:tetratricopeptide (TPR) repeat protein